MNEPVLQEVPAVGTDQGRNTSPASHPCSGGPAQVRLDRCAGHRDASSFCAAEKALILGAEDMTLRTISVIYELYVRGKGPHQDPQFS